MKGYLSPQVYIAILFIGNVVSLDIIYKIKSFTLAFTCVFYKFLHSNIHACSSLSFRAHGVSWKKAKMNLKIIFANG